MGLLVIVLSLDFSSFIDDVIIIIICVGNGKTHYIKRQLANCAKQLTIAVNEAFSPLKAITKLRSLPLYKQNVGLFFNFTILPPGVSYIGSMVSILSDILQSL